MSLTAEPPDRPGGRWTVRDEDGRAERVNPDDGNTLRAAARFLGVKLFEVRAALREAREALELQQAAQAEEVDDRPTTYRVWRSGMDPVPVGDLASALQATSTWEFLGWSGPGIAAVDVDLTEAAKAQGIGWTVLDAERVLRRPGPTPQWVWPTRSGGFRALFTGPDDRYGLTALERAGLWVLLNEEFCGSDRVDKVELIPVTRFPPAGVQPRRGLGEYGTPNLVGALLRTGGRDSVDARAVQEWLAVNAMEDGGRYDHTRCPVDPRPTTGQAPVVVQEGGVMCYVCGMLYAWARLVAGGAGEPDPAISMARELVHWEHARFVLAAERPRTDPPLIRAGYRALMHVLHYDELNSPEGAEIKRSLRSVWSRNRAYVRSQGLWLRTPEFEGHDTMSRQSLFALPWSHGDSDRVDRALSDARLEGYVPIEPVLHLVDEPTWREEVVLTPQPVTGAAPIESFRMQEAQDVLREALPGVTDNWLRMSFVLVVAALRAQLRLSAPPVLIVTGPSGSGKGSLVAFAAGVLGRPIKELAFDGPKELAMSIGQGLDARAAILFGDEVGKAEGWWYQSAPLLKLGATHAWRKLNVGHVVSPVRACVVLAGSTLPPGMTTMAEIDRRACMIDLRGQRRTDTDGWDSSVRRYLGVPGLEELRQTGMGAAVADAYVRAARLEVLRPGLPSWARHAESLGALTVRASTDMGELAQVVTSLYRLWRDGPDELFVQTGNRAGWLRCWRTGRGDDAAEALDEWIDPEAPQRERKARLGVLETFNPVPGVDLQVRDRGRRIAVRFVSDRAPGAGPSQRRDRELFPDAPL